MCRRDTQSVLTHECRTNPWKDCSRDMPKIITAAKDNLQKLFYGAISASTAFAGLILLTFLAAGEPRMCDCEVKTLGTPQFVSSV